MPVPAEEKAAPGCSKDGPSVDKEQKTSKQATIASLFQRSSKRKKCKEENSSVVGNENEKKKQKTEDVVPSDSNGIKGEENEKAKMDVDEETDIKQGVSLEKSSKKVIERCHQCQQIIHKDEIKMFGGDSPDAVDEFVMLCDPRLSLLTGNEQEYDNYDDRPQHKLTDFSVYDKCGHLCAFDTGLIDKNIELFFSGYVKPVYDENPDKEGGVCTKKMGPINEWWISGFDGGENALIGFSTAFAEYILMRPSDEYTSFMNAVSEKICMSKVVIEFIISNPEARYEELLNKIETTVPPENCSQLTEDSLLRHAQFLVDQVESFDSAAADNEEEPPLIATNCMRDLIKLAGVTLGKRRQLRGVKVKAEKKALGPTLATTTPLVRYVFDTFFKDQIDLKATSAQRKRRCGVCEICQQPDCGKCKACKDMVKFGGTGKAKQCCINRRCPNLAVQQADENAESQDEDAEPLKSPLKSPLKEDRSPKLSRKGSEKIVKTKCKWACEPHIEKKSKKMYKSVYINNEMITVGDYVKVCPDNPTDPLYICRVTYMWEDFNGKKMFHAQWLYRSAETVLGETGDPAELFLCDDCDNNPLGSIMCKCKVQFNLPTKDWFNEGGSNVIEHDADDDKEILTLQKWYDVEEGAFIDPPVEFLHNCFDERYCPCCDRESRKKKLNTPQLMEELEDENTDSKVYYRKFLWMEQEFAIGDCVYINPEAYKFKKRVKNDQTKSKKEETFDEETYPELYRKTKDYIKGSNVDIADPYRIGCILNIMQKKGSYGDNTDIVLHVRKFYRPENTHKGFSGSTISDLNLLYWCDEEASVSFDYVEGKCYVVYIDDPDIDVNEYTNGGPDRFYFTESYDPGTEEFDMPPSKARNELSGGKSSGKGKGKAKKKGSIFQQSALLTNHPVYEKVDKLRTLDIFAGCGGLSEGLHQVGVADSRWAIEFEPSAAQAYRLNNPGTIVFNADCNHILKLIMEGKETNESGQRLPRRGEVDLLCGGPPCQGFSGMNRFNHREYSMFKNSLVTSYLSYCDYFRPKFFILENVRNFVSFKKGMVLKLIMKCLLKMGYQCEFGVLQAGSYGVPQTRRRAILIAAAPGEILPKYPECQHVFAPKGLALSVTIDDKKYQAVKRLHTAPYRTITVRDAMSDLPEIKNGAKKPEIGYDSEPISHFQKMMRGKHVQQVLRDHVCKDMSPLVEARMQYIPCKPGSDWRDLPNTVVKLRDGNYTKKLLYLHHDKKQGPANNGDMRGICACATGASCDSADRQFNTLIPWCLPHTSNRHNHWAGLYGRLEWDGFFSTTVTNPEPMGKQGRVLHPEQHRVVSVRECARSQGFPDTFRFFGNILDKHRQIGNAVAPPMAAAIGQEIRKSIVQKKMKNNENETNRSDVIEETKKEREVEETVKQENKDGDIKDDGTSS